LKSQLELAHSEVRKTKEVIADLTKDLAAQREEREKAVQGVNMKLTEKESEVAEYKKDAEAVLSRHSQLESEVAVLSADASNAQVGIKSLCFYQNEQCFSNLTFLGARGGGGRGGGGGGGGAPPPLFLEQL
jgi:chromosome segregation ATPase